MGGAVIRSAHVSRYLLLSAAVSLAAVLLLFALRTYRELTEMQRIYLRDRCSMIADRLETFNPEQLAGPLVERLRHQEPGLSSIRLFQGKQSSDPPAVQAVRTGDELSRTEEVLENGRRLFRAWMPFHSAQQL